MSVRSDDELSPGYTAEDEERMAPEPSKRKGRTAFARDRARVLHSAALRRLAAKTQVHVAGEGDFPRTRLTHSLECAQVGRELGAALGCDPDLVEVACLSHDLGHPPFGHNGEDALHEISAGIGGFEGNAQSLRILTRLESKSFTDERSLGLNLTRAALDAATKYPWRARPGTRKFGTYDDDAEVFDWMRQGAPDERRCFEAQVMDWADDVAYSVHDLEDAIHAGHLDLTTLDSAEQRQAVVAGAAAHFAPTASPEELGAALEGLLAQPWWPAGYDGSHRSLAGLKNMSSQLIGRFCTAAENATREQHGHGRLTRYAADVVVPTLERNEVALLKAVTNHFVIRRQGSEAAYSRQRDIIAELVAALRLGGPDLLEPAFRDDWGAASDDASRLRVIVDQVAGLTDTSVMVWHRRLCRR